METLEQALGSLRAGMFAPQNGGKIPEKTKVGPFVKIGGTTSVQPDGSVAAENDAYGQTKYILEKFVKLLSQAGAEVKDVISVKAYAVDMKLGGEIARAYTEIFKEVRPLFTMVGTTALNRPTQLVEIELEAVITNA